MATACSFDEKQCSATVCSERECFSDTTVDTSDDELGPPSPRSQNWNRAKHLAAYFGTEGLYSLVRLNACSAGGRFLDYPPATEFVQLVSSANLKEWSRDKLVAHFGAVTYSGVLRNPVDDMFALCGRYDAISPEKLPDALPMVACGNSARAAVIIKQHPKLWTYSVLSHMVHYMQDTEQVVVVAKVVIKQCVEFLGVYNIVADAWSASPKNPFGNDSETIDKHLKALSDSGLQLHYTPYALSFALQRKNEGRVKECAAKLYNRSKLLNLPGSDFYKLYAEFLPGCCPPMGKAVANKFRASEAYKMSAEVIQMERVALDEASAAYEELTEKETGDVSAEDEKNEHVPKKPKVQ